MPDFHVEVPVWDSAPLSAATGLPVRLKMEALQPTGSFKIRGVGRLCAAACRDGAKHLVASSGGNAGYAVAYAGKRLATKVTVVVPESTPPLMAEKLRQEGALVKVAGAQWMQAHAHALELADSPDAAYIHPFDHPEIWAGHASLVEELTRQSSKPDMLVLSVGGGGLLCGVVEGLLKVGWSDVPVVAVETEGAASLASSVEAGRRIKLDTVDTVASCLAAHEVAEQAFICTTEHNVIPVTVSDRASVDACLHFARDHRLLVEPACGAALSILYDNSIPDIGAENVTVIVCGGAAVDLDLLKKWHSET